MKFGATIGIVAILAIGGVIVAQSTSTNSAQPASQQVLAASSKQLPADAVLYDVRTAEEYAISHVKTAKLFPLASMQAGQLPDVPKDAPIAVYCRTGHRAGQAVELLKAAGYTNITNVGGLQNLSDYGLTAE